MGVRIDLDAKVRTRDGEAAGAVERAVLDPRTNRVTEFVVGTGGLAGRSVVVPAAEIEAASREGEVLRLRLSRDELEQLPTYAPERYDTPPAGWAPPAGYGYPASAYLWPVALIDTAPPASPTAPARPGDVEAGSVSLAKGAAVVDQAGEHVGVVDEVRLDPETGHLTGFVMRVGGELRTLFGGGDVVQVTRDHIDSVDEGIVRLRVHKDHLRQGAGAG